MEVFLVLVLQFWSLFFSFLVIIGRKKELISCHNEILQSVVSLYKFLHFESHGPFQDLVNNIKYGKISQNNTFVHF